MHLQTGIKHVRNMARTGLSRASGSDRGVALLVVLWVLVILGGLATAFSVMARTETRATLLFKEGAERRFLAEAGIERAATELFYRAFCKKQAALPDDVARVDGTLYSGLLGSDAYTYRILEESGKIDINQMDDACGIVLDNLLVNRGVPKEQAQAIVDSILDWKDKDDLVRLNGAESEYYMSLPVPYKAKNARFDSVEELLLIRGITPAILYGTDGNQGIFDFLTVHADVNKINVNTAQRDVLAALPGIDPEGVEALIAARMTADIKSIQEMANATGIDTALMAPFISFTESSTYTIEAAGYKKGKPQNYTVTATVAIQGDTYQYVYYKSPAGTRKPKRQPGS